ncbi:hypothetical protein [Methanococcoides seepicolus]|uniref:Uncharacterized protein n=1 Tax=Methanococcoides seepicolus TaxID=2828780 RepID=A0A9E4ZFM7_9EURY|nr:hypothetical protein [Methanococcoides seepicolus]MCM1986044.1 hypothetical protein [Methanococcoides seepicolus]
MDKERKGSKKLLADSQKEYLKSYKNVREQAGWKADSQKLGSLRQNNKTIRDKMITALEDLTLYAQCMPEDQLKKVFTRDSLTPFLTALTDPEYTIPEKEKDNKIKNQRVFEICYLMEEIGIQNGYVQLSDDVQKMFMDASSYKHAVTPVRSIGLWECGRVNK